MRLWHFLMDTGGTFTDCLAQDPDGGWHRLKVLSSGAIRAQVVAQSGTQAVVLRGMPAAPAKVWVGFGISSGSRAVEVARVESWDPATDTAHLDRPLAFEAGEVVELSAGEEAPVLAMRLLTGTGPGEALPPADLRLATTRGTNALLEGKGACVAFFVTQGFGDLLRIGDQRRPDLFAIHVQRPAPLHGPVVEVRGRLGADGSELESLDLPAVREAALQLVARGIESAAVALMHSYRDPAHERAVARVLREAGFRFVSVSSELAPFIKILPRAETAVVDAVLAPVMETYLAGVAAAVDPARFRVMTSAGGLVCRAAYRAKDSLLSGPAGGVAGAAAAARRAGLQRIITFDMGGTSTDVARYEGDFDYQFQHTVGAARVFAPALRVESVAAGGGSICRFDGAALVVGPESAGARPGPACYGAGGPLTLTDVNLLLGRLVPGTFGVPVSAAAAEARLEEVLAAVTAAGGGRADRAVVLNGFIDIANERMAEAIRSISVREGYDPADYVLVAFGGAGGLHACAVAEHLGMRRVLHPADSGLLSACGLGEAVEERIVERQLLCPLEAVLEQLPALVGGLEQEGRRQLRADGAPAAAAVLRRAEVELRFSGQESGLSVPVEPGADPGARFIERYRERFGYAPSGRPVEAVTLRVVVSGVVAQVARETFPVSGPVPPAGGSGPGTLARAGAVPGRLLAGPVLVHDRFSSLHVAPGWSGSVGSAGSIMLTRAADAGAAVEAGGDVVQLELFTSRFRVLVEEMGLLLQRCALSVNVKERFDFSCALLDRQGELVANAPNVPVHLGALGVCVRSVREALVLQPGDVAITNHPAFGGAHLPDVTLIAPVHADGGGLIGYVANRAHHAEIGGSCPGSMPPDARRLSEEGVVLPPMLLVRAGAADWDGVRALLAGGPYPSRRVEENIADLHAQLASIQLGAERLRRLAGTSGAETIVRFMGLLKDRAADVLAHALRGRLSGPVRAVDRLDDGSPVMVAVRRSGSRLVVDFSGSGKMHAGNLNATPAIVRSALIYVLRLLAGRGLPLNEGLMRDVDLILPQGLLSPVFHADPAACPAVVGGNVETSQRIVDVLVRAFALAASSQGTMNSVILGNAGFSYYETIGGGTGAGDGFHGCDGIHSHMTNTAITDPEVLEFRLPVRIERFALRRGSGGAGIFRGGEGLERVMRVQEPMQLSVLTQRRASGPPGLCGGGEGARGRQWLDRADGTREALSGIAGSILCPGDRLTVLTPGGGGWGRKIS